MMWELCLWTWNTGNHRDLGNRERSQNRAEIQNEQPTWKKVVSLLQHPAIPGLGVASGFYVRVTTDNQYGWYKAFESVMRRFIGAVNPATWNSGRVFILLRAHPATKLI